MSIVKVDITVSPLGTSSTSMSGYVAACERVLSDFPNIRWQLNPMSTTLQGEFDEVMRAVRLMHEAPFGLDARRVITTLRIDDRRDAQPQPFADKMEKVRRLSEEGALG